MKMGQLECSHHDMAEVSHLVSVHGDESVGFQGYMRGSSMVSMNDIVFNSGECLF